MGFKAGQFLGLSLIAGVVVIWVLSSELIQFIFDDVGVSQPLFLTFYSTALFSIYLLGFIYVNTLNAHGRHDEAGWKPRHDDSVHGSLISDVSALEQALDAEEEYKHSKPHTPRSPKHVLESSDRILSIGQTAKKAAIFAPAWIAANWTFNASLCMACGSGTTVASNTVISSTSTVFTLMLSAAMLNERVSPLKILCVLLSVSGVILVTSADSLAGGRKKHEPSHVSDAEGNMQNNSSGPSIPVVPLQPHTLGDVLSLGSALLFACYSVQIKWLIPCEKNVRMPMFFGFLGVWCAALCIPLLAVLHSTGIEVLHPIPHKVLIYLTVNGMIGTVLSDLLWAKAIILTSPLTVNLGMSMTIPLSCLADYINPNASAPPMQWEYVVGLGMVFVSFVLINASEVCWPEVEEDASTSLPTETADEGEKSSLLLGGGERNSVLEGRDCDTSHDRIEIAAVVSYPIVKS